MGDFEPSGDFTTKIMAGIHAYEATISHEREWVGGLQLSKPAFYALSAGGVLLGIFNLVRFASILISPVPCL